MGSVKKVIQSKEIVIVEYLKYEWYCYVLGVVIIRVQ